MRCRRCPGCKPGVNVAGGKVIHPAVAEGVGVEYTPVEEALEDVTDLGGSQMSIDAVIDRATGETVEEYPTITDDQLRAAIGRADEAHRNWSASSSVADRAALVRRVGRAAS